MPDTRVRKVTIFVSSPKDVAPERGRVQAVTAKLNREYEGLVRFETVLWEEHFYTADKSFQPQIPEAVASDIVMSIFWTRVGTELPADFPRMPNGKPYPSGTAYELLTALDASKAKGVPDVYVFRKTADAILPMADSERRRQAHTQLEALEAFWSEWFKSEKGEFKAAFQNFPSTDAFEQQTELLLRQWLESRGLLGPRIAWPKEKGSPFPGLAPFEAEHAAVFFGRARVIDEARRRLAAAAERGTAFLLIVGASGSGKSSLARAGLIPRLTTPGVVASVDLWRVARMKPGEGQAGPLTALATALLAPDALPELAHGDYPTAASLADNLRRGGTASVQPISSALARVAEAAQRERHADQPPKPALVLLVDQFEELFAQRVSDAERAAFAESLQQLITTRQVWLTATLRADFYELLLKQPVLKALKETGASLDLGPPGPAELAEIVRAPAAAAGLVFGTDTEKGELGDRLLADAKSADSLPLLQFTLRQLYERREESAGEVKLTHAAYDQLGGLAGAIAAEARGIEPATASGRHIAAVDAAAGRAGTRRQGVDAAGSLARRRGARCIRVHAVRCAADGAHPDRPHRCGRTTDGAAGARCRLGELAEG
jgi:energy-coupling factor transporter ATP-binding protein EcfA2